MIRLLLLLLLCPSLYAASVQLEWDPITDTGLAGYTVKVGRAPGVYDSSYDVGTALTYTVSNLGYGTYYFRVYGYEADGRLGDGSRELFYTVPDPSNDLKLSFGCNDGNLDPTFTEIYDESGNGNMGTLNNVTWGQGKFGTALQFDGTGYVQVYNMPSIDISGNQITVSAWVKVSPSTGDEIVLIKPWYSSWNGPFYQYGVVYSNARNMFDFYLSDTAGTLYGPYSFNAPTDTWTHVAFVYNGSTVKGYRDGAQKFSYNLAVSIPARGQAMVLGADSVHNQKFIGNIDEIRVYGRALSQAEVTADMNTPVSLRNSIPDAPVLSVK